MLESLNKVLKNDGDNKLDYSHSLLQKSQAAMDSSLSSLLSTPKLTLNTFS